MNKNGTLWFAINCWKEELMLPGCLESIRRNHPEAKIVAVDGAYSSLVGEVRKEIALAMDRKQYEVAKNLEDFVNPESNDATLEILRDFKVDKVIQCNRDSSGTPIPWKNEREKRSQYFVGGDGDYYFVIDADERLVGQVDKDSLVNDSYNVVLRRDEEVPAYRILRIYRHQAGMHYEGAHHALWVGGRLYRKEESETIKGCMLEHHQNYRVRKEPIRNSVKGFYYRQLCSEEEGAFRAQNNL